MDQNKQLLALAGTRVAVDIGSTVVKIARVGNAGELVAQDFHPRDFHAGIASQVELLLEQLYSVNGYDDVLVCSSANGGLRVGIVCLTHYFSGATLRNQVLLAGANPIFVRSLDEDGVEPDFVDMLLVAGGDRLRRCGAAQGKN